MLPQGASIGLRVTALVPVDFDRCGLANLAEIVGAPGGSRWNTNPDDDKDVAVVKVPKPDCTTDTPDVPEVDHDPIPLNTNLKIEKKFLKSETYSRGEKWDSMWSVTVTNTGPGTYRGEIRFDELFPAGMSLLSRSPELNCSGTQCVSDDPVTLNPSESISYGVYLTGPKALAVQLNCRITNKVKLVNSPGIPITNTDASDDAATATGTLPAELCVGHTLTPERNPIDPKTDVPGPTTETPNTPRCRQGRRLEESPV